MVDLQNSVVLVVGASGVLGSLISGLLTDSGATVVRAGRSPDSLSGAGTVLADLTTAGSAEAIVAAALAANGRLDGLVIAAGVVAFGPAHEVSDETLHQLFEINTLGPIRLIREAVPALSAAKVAGSSPFIVTMSGIVAEVPTAGLAAYSASKAGLAAFVQATSRELRRSGIRMIDARPGHTETGLADRAIAGEAAKFPAGLEPAAVAARILRAIVDDEKDLPSTAF